MNIIKFARREVEALEHADIDDRGLCGTISHMDQRDKAKPFAVIARVRMRCETETNRPSCPLSRTTCSETHSQRQHGLFRCSPTRMPPLFRRRRKRRIFDQGVSQIKGEQDYRQRDEKNIQRQE